MMAFQLHLAPMEGVVDFVLRDVLTGLGGIDHCVTEFVRVTDKLHSPAILERYAPEMKMGWKTRSGTPLFLQFLGGQAGPLAENAAHAADLGALGIDLNFGCPAKTVNRHDGGASLLRTPERIFKIVEAVRRATPSHIPVTAKMRLGFDDPAMCFENAQAAQSGGAHWLTVHCRTKTDGYKPPAHWEWIPQIKEKVPIPIVANGEIWTVKDFWKCVHVTACDKIMMGRGAVAQPFLFKNIKSSIRDSHTLESAALSSPRTSPQLKSFSETNSSEENSWEKTKNLLPRFFQASSDFKSPFFAQARTKQWLKALSLQNEPAKPLFEELKVVTNPFQFRIKLETLCS